MEIPSKDICAQVYFPQGKHRENIYLSVIIEVNLKSPQISAHKADRVSFSLLFLCASLKMRTQTVSASAVNLLHKKHTLAETMPYLRSNAFFV